MNCYNPKSRIPTLALVAVLSTVLAAACGKGPAATAAHSPAPSASATAISSGPLDCRLPVAGFVPGGPKGQPDPSIGPDGQPNQKGTGGFFDFRTGTYTPASDSNISYVPGARAWLPVQQQAIAPDQGSYVTGKQTSASNAAPTTSLYVVDARTGAERVIFTAPDGDMAYVLAYTSAGIYVGVTSSTGPGPIETLVIDPVSGAHHPVPGSQPAPGVYQQAWTAISGGAAWGFALTFPNGQSQPYLVTLMRLDLATGKSAAWYKSQSVVTVIGFDAGDHPLVSIPKGTPDQPLATTLAIFNAPNSPVFINAVGGTFMQSRGQGFRDGHGTWFGSFDGSIWLYASGALKKVATIPPQPGATGTPYDQHFWRSVAGPCV